MGRVLRWVSSWLTGGALDRVLTAVEDVVDSKTDRERIKGEIIRTHYETRAGFMKAGGFWLMVMFAAPLAFWFGAVCVYSVLWCADCAYPKPWTVAALPAPLDAWAHAIIISLFGVFGVTRIAGK